MIGPLEEKVSVPRQQHESNSAGTGGTYAAVALDCGDWLAAAFIQ